jgi:hypothetical protein
MKRIKHNDLTHYFMTPHEDLPASYLASCEKFFIDLKLKKALKDGAYKRWKKLLKQKAASCKRQAASFKQQALDKIGL